MLFKGGITTVFFWSLSLLASSQSYSNEFDPDIEDHPEMLSFTNSIPGKYTHNYKVDIFPEGVRATWDFPGPPPWDGEEYRWRTPNHRIVVMHTPDGELFYRDTDYNGSLTRGSIKHPRDGGDHYTYLEYLKALADFTHKAAYEVWSPNPQIEIYADGFKDDVLRLESREIPAEYELVRNGDFSDRYWDWNLSSHQGAEAKAKITQNTELEIKIADGGDHHWQVQLIQNDFQVISGAKYRLSFDAAANRSRKIGVSLEKPTKDWDNYGIDNRDIYIDPGMRRYSFEFVATGGNTKARLAFQLGGDSHNKVYLDNVSLQRIDRQGNASLIKNGFFSEDTKHWQGAVNSTNAAMNIWTNASGQLVADISKPGDQYWQLQILQRGVPTINGQKYRLGFLASAAYGSYIGVTLEKDGSPWNHYGLEKLYLWVDSEMTHHEFDFYASESDPKARLVFQVGGNGLNQIFLDNITLKKID